LVVATRSSLPPGYSPTIVDVKFQDGTDVDLLKIKTALPQHLANAITHSSKIFNLPKDKLDKIRATGRNHSGKTLPDLNLWFRLTLKPSTDPMAFIADLKNLPGIEIAEPAPEPQPPPAITPDFTASQGYLNAATDGIDARFSWTIPGGNGIGITIYDVEYSWNQAHEDLSKAHGTPLLLNPGDSAVDPFSDNNHGTAVLGEIVADNDTKGVTGISWGAGVRLAPANSANLGYNPANAILLAVADGSPGDVILIEQQANVCGLGSFGPTEWISSVFDAIQTAVANRIVVVEAAGNGNVNLDQAACGTTFNRTVRDSGAIIVGAGRPPSSGFDRQRESFSSYGSRVDLQGWGSSVETAGYGNGYRNPDALADSNFWYTNTFSGTSSASPIVTGAAANLQGISLNRSGTPLTPFELRQLLVATGSPQLGATEHIGPRPDLKAAYSLLPSASLVATVTSDNSYDLYFNGVYKGSGSDWTVAQTYTMPTQTGKNVLAIRCADAGWVAGLLADLRVNGQHTGSNTTWKVSKTAPANWTDPNFDDSTWANATDYGPYGVGPWGTNVANMPLDTPGRWIWSSNNDLDDLVYLRVTFGTQQNATAIVTSDNSYDLYFNGVYKGSGSDWTVAQTYTMPTQTGKNVLAIRCADAGWVAGLLAELQVNGQRLGSNVTWKVSLSAPANWTDVNFDDSGWANATDYGAYGVWPWFTNVAGMPMDTPARWIWSSNNDLDDLVFLRVSFNAP
jgi:hypothetical protein